MEEENKQPETISKKLLFVNALLVAGVAFMSLLIFTAKHQPSAGNLALVVEANKLSPFDSLDIEAKAVYVFDIVANKVLFKKNEFVQLPLASITKLMTALVATDILPNTFHVTIKKEFMQEEGDTGLLVNESWRLKDLLDFSLTVSSNDGARSIASVVGAFDLKTEDYDLGRKDFIEKMNEKAQTLGLLQTYFINESGLDEGATSGGYGSAIDVAKLLQYILVSKPEVLEATTYPTLNIGSLNKTHVAKNTNVDVNNIPGLLASKTGYTELAGGNLAIAFDASIGRPIIVVVLGSSEKGRFEDVSKLVKASLAYIRE